MGERGQAGFGESSVSGESAGAGAARDSDASADPVARIEAALGTLRGGPPPGFGRGRPRGFGLGSGWAHPGEEHARHGEHEPHEPHEPHGPHGDHGPHRGPGGRGGHAAVRLLLALSHHGPMSVNEIADHVGVDQPRASRLVRAAVEAGHVRREPDPNDARRSILAITEGGRSALAALIGRRRGAVERALADFSDAEREQFAALFTRFAEAWRRG